MKNKSVESNIFMYMWLTWLVLIGGLITSCSLFAGTPVDAIPSKELVFPKADDYDGLINRGESIIVLINGGSQQDLESYAKEGDSQLTPFSLPNDPDCFLTNYYGDQSLPDGRMQISKLCGSGGNGTDTYLMAYDWETKRLMEIVGPLPLGTSEASWNPDQTKAIAYLDGGFATRTLYWISNDGYSPLDLVIGDQNHSWNLKDDFPDFKADDTGETGTTGRAAWSPNGKSIAFFASPDAVGKIGFERFSVEYNLYLMDPTTLQPKAVANSIYSPFFLVWSPDSNRIAFIGKYGFRKENGIWLYSIKTKSVTEISEGIFQGIAWRPDSKHLVALRCQDLEVCTQVYEYDLTQIVEP